MKDNLEKKFLKEYEKLKQNVQKVNILLAGKTGAGKSSIVNMIFGYGTAQAGTGRPVTQKIDVYEDNTLEVRIFDSKGYELGAVADKEFYDEVVNLSERTNDPRNVIHLIWYCIDSSGHRVTDYDINAVEAFKKSGLPVAIVLTKADLVTDEESAEIKKTLPAWAADCTFETTNSTDEKLKKYNNIDKLVTWSAQKLSDAQKLSFIRSQKANLEEKYKQANIMVAQHAVTAASSVLITPLPFSDAPLLIANEMALMVRIMHLYDIDDQIVKLETIGIQSILGKLLTMGGKYITSQLLRIIPIAGKIVSATVATGIVTAFGEGVNISCYNLYKAKLDGKDITILLDTFGNTIMENAIRQANLHK